MSPKYATICFTLLLGVFLFGLAQRHEIDEVAAEQIQYCKMVALHDETSGEFGWPDYQHTFDEFCNADGSAKEH